MKNLHWLACKIWSWPIWTHVNASAARPSQMDSQVDQSYQLTSICESIWPGLNMWLTSIPSRGERQYTSPAHPNENKMTFDGGRLHSLLNSYVTFHWCICSRNENNSFIPDLYLLFNKLENSHQFALPPISLIRDPEIKTSPSIWRFASVNHALLMWCYKNAASGFKNMAATL